MGVNITIRSTDSAEVDQCWNQWNSKLQIFSKSFPQLTLRL